MMYLLFLISFLILAFVAMVIGLANGRYVEDPGRRHCVISNQGHRISNVPHHACADTLNFEIDQRCLSC